MPAGNNLTLAEIETIGGVLLEAATIWRIKDEAMRFVVGKVEADGSILVFADDRSAKNCKIHHYTDAPPVRGDTRKLRDHCFDRDPVFQALRAELATKDYAVVSLDQVVDMQSFRRSQVYRDVYRRHGLNQVITAVVTGIEGHLATLTFFRNSDDAPFHADDVALVRALMPHIGGAMRRIILRQRLLGLGQPDDGPADFTWFSTEGRLGMHRLAKPEEPSARAGRDLPAGGRQTVLDEESGRFQAQMQKLSPRENEIAQLVSKGLTNVQIAELASISYRTVELHVSAILRKLELNNRTELSYLICSLAWQPTSEAGVC